jgi:hypothetical protein
MAMPAQNGPARYLPFFEAVSKGQGVKKRPP